MEFDMAKNGTIGLESAYGSNDRFTIRKSNGNWKNSFSIENHLSQRPKQI
jgi:hypothetical protein